MPSRVPWANEVENVVDGFIGWLPWVRRTELLLPDGGKVVEYAGVYLFGEFGEVAPKVEPSHDDPAIFYVGETGRPLGRRWYDYDRSRWFTKAWGKSPDQVWVAAFPIWIGGGDRTPEPITKQFRLYTERRIIWEHVLKGRRLLNMK